VAFQERIVPRETVEIMVNLAGPHTVVDPFRPEKKVCGGFSSIGESAGDRWS
jgi:hypothetical protein